MIITKKVKYKTTKKKNYQPRGRVRGNSDSKNNVKN